MSGTAAIGGLAGYLNDLRQKGGCAFMPYLTVGYPSAGDMLGILGMLRDCAADCLELGVPFSDPIADGVTIQNASQRALSGGMTSVAALRVAERAARIGMRVIWMSYSNPIFRAGLDDTARRLACAGVEALLVPDLPLEEAGRWRRTFDSAGVALALFAAPTTPRRRLASIGRTSRAFVYYVSLTGVTGERKSLPVGLPRRLLEVRLAVKMPVCVGFGVSSPRQAALVAGHAEGVIVGSALVRRLAAWGRGPEERRGIARWVGRMASAIHSA